ncbi:MAG: hypothetical protein IIB22_04405 [Chloroflexi bacterium]|nr:hypothetical protein [Chloroflexota bacterium]
MKVRFIECGCPVVYGMGVMVAFRVFLIALALTAPVWALHATSVSACSCVGSSDTLEQRLQAADVVLVGRVVDLRLDQELPSRTPQFNPDNGEEISDWYQGIDVVSVFRVDELLRGSAPNPLEIHSYTDVSVGPGDEVLISSGGSGDCGFAFTLESRYVLYYSTELGERVSTGGCSQDRVSIQDDQHLEKLKQLLHQPKPQPTVVDLPETGMGSGDPDGSLSWHVTAAAAGVLLAAFASAIFVAVRRRAS